MTAAGRVTDAVRERAWWAALAACAVTWSAVRIDHRFISFSDGAYTYLARAVAQQGGHALYGTLVLSQPPAAVLGAGALWRVAPGVEILRVALAVLAVACVLLTYALARANAQSHVVGAFAGVLALTAPIQAEFAGGLDGEALLAPLAVAGALLAQRHRWTALGVLAGAGFLVKATWVPFAVAAILVAIMTGGPRAALRTAVATTATAGGLWLAAGLAFGWSASDVWAQLIVGQSGSGLQIALFVALVGVTAAMWWPLLALAVAGRHVVDRVTLTFLLAGLAAGASMLKQGTFFNVLHPAEPFLAVVAAAGAARLARQPGRRATLALAACCCGLIVHVASSISMRTSRALAFPVGSAFVSTDNEQQVDSAVRAIERHSGPRDRVLVNPLLAVLARRRELEDQADWFMVHALQRTCHTTATPRCALWREMKSTAKRGGAAVVSVDSNVEAFDAGFAEDVGAGSMRRLLSISRPPLKLSLRAP